MDYSDVFKRYEIKYLITDAQRREIDLALEENAKPDRFGKTEIHNIYYDTPDYRLIRRSIEKPVYKEKLRVRCYGTPTKDSNVFVELKKKYKSVTYKRRIKTTLPLADGWLCGGPLPSGRFSAEELQIEREINYALGFYGNLAPAVCISYDREAFAALREKQFRVTFDRNILWRRDHLALYDGTYGKTILPEGYTLMEVKTPGAMPLWFTEVLARCKIYSTHFSKYGRAYMALAAENTLPPAQERTQTAAAYRAATGGIIYA